jgi:hypothetical protein
MKFFLACSLVSAVFAASSSAFSQTTEPSPDHAVSAGSVPWDQLPEAVRRGFNLYSGQTSMAGIQQTNINGLVVYRGIHRPHGQPVELWMTEDGSRFSPQRLVTWNELPSAVQESFRAVNAIPAIQSISQRTTPAGSVYEFSLTNETELAQLQIDRNGLVVGHRSSTAPGKPVNWNDLPVLVQNAAREQLGNAQIVRIEQGTFNSRPVYNVTGQADGVRNEIHLSPEGILVGGITLSEAAGSFNTARSLKFDDLPLFAQNAVRQVSEGAPILAIRNEIVNGQRCYEVAFERQGQVVNACISAEGKIVR